MKNKHLKRGFTLIEMLVVVVIIGIIMAIVISSATSFLNNRDAKLYESHMDVVEVAVKSYINKYNGILNDKSNTCFNLNYDALKEDGLKETDVFCSGSVIITRTNNNSFNKEYYLKCVNQKGEVLSTTVSIPSGCKQIN